MQLKILKGAKDTCVWRVLTAVAELWVLETDSV